MMEHEMIQLRRTNYYMIVNKATHHSLYLPVLSQNYEKESVLLAQPDQGDLSQVWMIVQVNPDRFPNMFEIVHTVSTLVLSTEKDQMRLRFGKWKSNQLFFLHRHNPKMWPNEFYIRQEKDSNKYLTFGKNLACIETSSPDDRSIWELVLVRNNDIINRSCYIEYAYSNMVLDVPQASDKLGVAICQYPCNNRFNQRWNIKKRGAYFQIENLKTKMCLDIKGQSKRSGTPIVQWKSTGAQNQLWSIQYQGKNIYLIRSAMDPKLLLSVKDNSLKECADIVTTNQEDECFWRIVGYLPQRQ